MGVNSLPKTVSRQRSGCHDKHDRVIQSHVLSHRSQTLGYRDFCV